MQLKMGGRGVTILLPKAETTKEAQYLTRYTFGYCCSSVWRDPWASCTLMEWKMLSLLFLFWYFISVLNFHYYWKYRGFIKRYRDMQNIVRIESCIIANCKFWYSWPSNKLGCVKIILMNTNVDIAQIMLKECYYCKAIKLILGLKWLLLYVQAFLFFLYRTIYMKYWHTDICTR